MNRLSHTPRRLAAVAAGALLVVAISLILPGRASAENLPYSASTNPFIWDNDSEHDAFALDFVMALADEGELNLIGISESPDPYKSASEDYQAILNDATDIGWANLPATASYDLGTDYMTALTRPSDGNIDETTPIDSAGAEMIESKVLSDGTSTTPVVVGTGGALTTVASAYLLAEAAGEGTEFAQRMVLYADIGVDGGLTLNDYNASQDEWAAYICLSRLTTVLTEYTNADHNEPNFWSLIDELPANQLGEFMQSVKAGWPYLPYEGVGDEQAVLDLLNPNQGDYFNYTQRVSVNGFDTADWAYGSPGVDNLNWNAYEGYVDLQDDSSSDDIAVYGLNNPDSFITSTFSDAFGLSGSSPVLGYDGTATDSSSYSGAGETILYRFQAASDATLTTTDMNIASVSSSENVKMAIYADNSGSPGSLLAVTSGRTGLSPGWQQFTLTSSLPVTAGTYYWIGYMGDTGTDSSTGLHYYANMGSGSGAYRTGTYPTFSDPFGTPSATWSDRTADMYAAGSGGSSPVLGYDGTATDSSSYSGAGETILYRFQAASDATLTTTDMNIASVSSSENVKMAIYADNSGSPGSLLAVTSGRTGLTSGWQSFTLTSSLSVSAGTYYWIGYMGDTGTDSSTGLHYYANMGSGSGAYRTGTYPTFSDPFGTPSATWSDRTADMYAG